MPDTPRPDHRPHPLTPARALGDPDGLLHAALEYAARGWHVIPLRPTGTARDRKRPAFPDHTQDTCTGRDPRCARAGRHVTWAERATTDPDRITRAWFVRRRSGSGSSADPPA